LVELLLIINKAIKMPRKKDTKQMTDSDSDDDFKKVGGAKSSGSDESEEDDDQQIVGFVGERDEFGRFDDSQMEDQQEEKKTKGKGFVRKWSVRLDTRVLSNPTK